MNIPTMQIIRKLLIKAIGIIDAEIQKEKGGPGTCPHTDITELLTMRMGKKTLICNTCGEQFTEEVEYENPQTMGRRRPGNGDPGRTQTGAQGS